MVCTDIFFPLGNGGQGNQVERTKLNSAENWVVSTLKKHHKKENSRPYCLCSPSKPRMQIYEHPNGKLYLKRLPDTGHLHHISCDSHGDTVSSKKRDYKDAVYYKDGVLNVSGLTSLTMNSQGRVPRGENGGSQRTGNARHRISLSDFFNFLWDSAGLLVQKENEVLHYNIIKEGVAEISSRVKYNGTLLSDVLIIPDRKSEVDQRKTITEKAEANDPKKKLIVIGMLNKLKHQPPKADEGSFSRYYLFLYNGPGSKPIETIPYYLDVDLFQKAQKELNFTGNEWGFKKEVKGKVWVVAIIEKRKNPANVVYGKVSKLSLIPVTDEHVPIVKTCLIN